MHMKFIALILLATGLFSCGNQSHVPDVSAIAVTVKVERFEQAFFSMDSNHVAAGLVALNRQYPYFLNDFVANVLGAGNLSDTNPTAVAASRQFLCTYLQVEDSIARRLRSVGWLEKELQRGFQLVKYYFPNYPLPAKVVTFIGPFDAPGVVMTRYTLGIGLQQFAGQRFSFYKSLQGQELYPDYISRRFEFPYITPNCMMAIAQDLFPDNSADKPLLTQMVEKGKYWWLVDKFLPETPDSLKTGFSQKQLDWCQANEGEIWNFFLQRDMYTLDPDLIKDYIGEGPNTQGMPASSPGNIGQWVGWRIVQKYASDHPTISPEELMKTDAKKIVEEAKYKPK
jgi:hypothetical protein